MSNNYPTTRKCKHGHTKHGGIATPEYTAWAHMIQRTTNTNCPAYSEWGGRGIGVCDEWLDFRAFYADMGDRPTAKHSLERRDNEKGYSPKNCYWATDREQTRNTRRNRLVEWNNRTQTATDWALELGASPHSLNTRFRRGWSVERAMTTPFSSDTSAMAH